MAAKNYWNGIVIGIMLAVLALFAAKNITVLSFIGDIISWIADLLAGQEWFPVSLGEWAYFDYVIASTIGFLIGLYIEYK